jgi:hypothetical protein
MSDMNEVNRESVVADATASTDITVGITTQDVTYYGYARDKKPVEGETALPAPDIKVTMREQPDLVKDGWVLVGQRVVKYPEVQSLNGFTTLIEDMEQQIYIVGRGVAAILNSKIPTTLAVYDEKTGTFPEFDTTQSALDVTSLLQEAPKRKVGLSDESKALNMLKGLTPEQLANIMALLGK